MDTNKFMYRNTDGELFDVEGAFTRHTALVGNKSDLDISVATNPSYELDFTISVGAGTMARLCQILNAAPVNGDPLGATVNLKLDTTATSCEVEDIGYFLFDNDLPPTLENIAAGYLHEGERHDPLEVNVALGNTRKKYAVTPVIHRFDSDGEGLSNIAFKIPSDHTDAEPTLVTVVSEHTSVSMENLVGHTIGGDAWRIIHTLKPRGNARYGGLILESA